MSLPISTFLAYFQLIVAEPGRKRDSDPSAGEPLAFGKIVEDHFSRVFV
jgi:hypothetical protein